MLHLCSFYFKMLFMLNEIEVIDKLCIYLEKQKYTDIKRCKPKERGIDITAKKVGKILYIEAKGGKSSDENSKRAKKGLEFDSSQIDVSVATAILKTMQNCHKYKEGDFAMAFPNDNNQRFKKIIKPIYPLLEKIGFKIYFVSENNVEIL